MAPDQFIRTPPRSRAVVTAISPAPERWPTLARERGALVFADVGWDPSRAWSRDTLGRLDQVDAFLPNAVEAMSYTRTDTPERWLMSDDARARCVSSATTCFMNSGVTERMPSTGKLVRSASMMAISSASFLG